MMYSEVEALLTELSGARAQLSQVEHAVQLKERDLFDERRRADVRPYITIYTLNCTTAMYSLYII